MPLGRGKYATKRMHRIILGVTDDAQVDHIDGDCTNNKRDNLRICDNVENCRNRRKRSGSFSPFKGVGWKKTTRRWYAAIKAEGRSIHLGYFGSEDAAARAYDKAALQHFGEFARLNFPIPNQR